jgi:hypothetical protein
MSGLCSLRSAQPPSFPERAFAAPSKSFQEEHLVDNDLEARIRTRAYHLWENDPSPDGNAEKHWEEARRQIEAEGGDQRSGPEVSADQSADRERGGEADEENLLQDTSSADGLTAENPSGAERGRS